MNLGIDIGMTIRGDNVSKNFIDPAPNAFAVIKELHDYYDHIYIISRVNSDQRRQTLDWFDKYNFFHNTEILRENIYYCFDRRDKAIFVKGLGINVFIDNRADVLMHMDSSVRKYLINPDEWDMKNMPMLTNCQLVRSWSELRAPLISDSATKYK